LDRGFVAIDRETGMGDVDDRELDPMLGQRIGDTGNALTFRNEDWHGVFMI
jgi:hypothetical protein